MENTNSINNTFSSVSFSIILFILFLCILILIYIVRKKKISSYEPDIELFLKQLDEKLKTTYPKMEFDFKYLEKIKNEQNIELKKYALLDNIINQYKRFKFTPVAFNKPISSNLLWSSYAFNSKNLKNKLPDDWLLRKNAIYMRDEKICQRCSKKLQAKDIDIMFVKPLEKGGDFYLENMVLVCTDCVKVEKHKIDETQSLNFLEIREDLYQLVKNVSKR
jgi:hypothetical protein